MSNRKVKCTVKCWVEMTNYYTVDTEFELDDKDEENEVEIDKDLCERYVDYMWVKGTFDPSNQEYPDDKVEQDSEITDIVSFTVIVLPKFIDPNQLTLEIKNE